MKHPFSTLLMLAVLPVLLSACASAPQREPYVQADQVGQLDPDSFVGTWQTRILNPVAGENDQQVTYQLNSDGTWITKIIPAAEQSQVLGPMEFVGTGVWQLDGEVITTRMSEVSETSGNRFGPLMSSAVEAFASNITGEMDPYEVSDDRIVLVNAESGQAMLLERL